MEREGGAIEVDVGVGGANATILARDKKIYYKTATNEGKR